MRVAAAVLVGIAALAGCSGAPQRPAPAPVPVAPAAQLGVGARAAALASDLVGRPYRYGGASADGFDCSGLVWYVYRELGVAVPRTAAAQRAAFARVPREALAPGDLVFFYTPKDHVGIYVGDGEFVHAPASGRSVQRARIDAPFFILGFAGGARVVH